MNIKETIQLALQYYQAGNLQQTEYLCKEILKAQPHNADILHLLGVIYYQCKNYDFALKYITEAVQFNPANSDAYYNLGNVFTEKGQLDKAGACYQKALQLNPQLTDAYNNLGNIFANKGQLDEAINCYQKALQLNSNFTEAYNNTGLALQDKGQFDEAIAYYQKALQINQNYVEAYNNLGLTFQEQGQFEKATDCYRKALQLNPNFADAHYNLSQILLLTGNFKDGWKESVWRWKIIDNPYRRHFKQPVWNGSDISNRTILLLAEEGFGDTIQFIRYVPLVAQRSAEVVIVCQKDLRSLFKNFDGIYKVIAYGEKLPEFDVYCHLEDLPFIFETTLESIPATIPYIAVDPVLTLKWRDKVQHDNLKMKIGIAWSANPTHKNERNRSCLLTNFLSLAQLDEITFFSLQKGDAATQAKNPPHGMKLIDYTDGINDFSDTAAFIENLDLVISADTAVVHLAGALGKPVWTLIPFSPDSRWLLNREDSPWYPTMRLFRQNSPGDWDGVFERVYIALKETLDNRRG
ncbi:MAG: tetratricopeptide repeat protein [Nitrospira sp.]|nr:tetratricopeptide repeat protein [Nitrospira sp.]